MKMAILGAGNIARKMAKTINALEPIEAYAIAARDLSKAEEFAKENGFAKAYGSYEEMVKDPEIDLVYVSTPHSHHYQHVKLCLENNKNVICEKSFTVNATQAKELFALAEEKNLFLTEAIWTRYLPMRKILNDVIASGVIGDVKTLYTSFSFNNYHVPRMHLPELAGGALLDLGVYALTFASMVLGNDIEEMSSSAMITDTGVDGQNAVTIKYKNGSLASLQSSCLCMSNNEGIISGSDGYILAKNIMNMEWIKVYNKKGELVQTIEKPEQITGFEYEVMSCYNAISNGKLECPEMPHSESIVIMETMDAMRKMWGLTYPCE